MTKAIVSSLILFLVSASCSNQTVDSKKSNDSEKNTYKIELVNNKKWEVDKEMMLHIRNMESDIVSSSNQSSPDFDKLGSKLDKNIGLLTSNCTMTGKAHDELHKWLLPFIDLVEELNSADSAEEQKESFDAIRESMNEFNAYFK